ncbi:TVP38/TMEM64 family protein [Cohnella luojiensis]|uniref:TVP38/TMEM64 family membrane protein n=1 Tax=Cohnella luojiensis TaxID=652876 RepID=A0A4Y8LMQ9_9BACL|nr:VTT domain-containing protein [Cohnella luojiensis]TFE19399.1 TVP38/TMEM64 family protein [Cohnella luojiensis]
MLKKSLIIGIYILAAVVLAVYRSPLIRWMSSETVWYVDILIFLSALLISIVPAIPYGIVAVVIGAKYGALIGACVNIAISVLGAIILFIFVRATFSEEGRFKAANMRGIVFFTTYAERNPFFAVLFARLLPIIPAQAINIFAAIMRIPWKVYLYATILGKIPFILMVSLLGAQFLNAPDFKITIITISVYGFFLFLVYGVFRIYSKHT